MPEFNQAIAVRRQQSQRGSALLIVLVLAAIVAIMLYRELPVAAFEAQRQKEELLVSRGNEYKRGVKLFVRKIGRFPVSISELESTNRMRFLRHKYTDPLTGKDDWRLIHAGPGGTIIDSKVQDASAKGKAANALGQGAVFAGFNNTFTGDATAAQESAAPSAALRARPAATKNAGSLETDPMSVPPSDPASADMDALARQGAQPGQPPTDPISGQPSAGNIPGFNAGQNAIGQPGDPNSAQGNGIGSVAQQLNNVNPKTPEQASSTSAFGNTGTPGSPANLAGAAGNNQISAAGGIAGVASIAKGKSIKTVNDQTKYSFWEFYYDLRKDQQGGAAGALGGQQNANGANSNGSNTSAFGQNSGPGQAQSAFGASSSQSSFGAGSSQSSFGASTSSGFGGASSQRHANCAPSSLRHHSNKKPYGALRLIVSFGTRVF